MKLDGNLIEQIMKLYSRCADQDVPTDFEDYLRSLDLVVKPGDSSQSTLVENK